MAVEGPAFRSESSRTPRRAGAIRFMSEPPSLRASELFFGTRWLGRNRRVAGQRRRLLARLSCSRLLPSGLFGAALLLGTGRLLRALFARHGLPRAGFLARGGLTRRF